MLSIFLFSLSVLENSRPEQFLIRDVLSQISGFLYPRRCSAHLICPIVHYFTSIFFISRRYSNACRATEDVIVDST